MPCSTLRCLLGTVLRLVALAAGVLALDAAVAAGSHVPSGDREARKRLAELEEDLRAPRGEKRRVAVKRLAELAAGCADERVHRAAWDHVIAALEDGEPEVADTAQLALAKIEDDDLLGELCGRRGLRSREPWVRLRVAEALGRASSAVDGEALLDALALRERDLARTRLWSVERLARAGRLAGERAEMVKDIEKAWRGARDGDVKGQALLTLVELTGEGARERVRAACSERDPAVRCAAAEAARVLEDAERLTRVRALAADEASSVRAAAIDALRELGDRGAALALVERLEQEERGRLRVRLVDALQELSGLFYRQDPRPWRLWAEGLPAGWRRGAAARRAEERGGGGTKAQGILPVLSDRVAFLVDFSGSLWHVRDDGSTRKAKADAALAAALERLGEDARFNVVPYTEEPHPWADGLRPASRAERADALRSFERCRERGTGNFFDAALLALADPEVDTIVVLTDGAPTGGRRWDMALMTDLLLERNRFRRVAFDAVVVDAPKRLYREWERLAAASGGRAVAIEME